ncbi:MAG: DMT family transporter [Pseudomonadota bacterium]
MRGKETGRLNCAYCLSILALIYAAVVWGSTFFLVKRTLQSVDPVTLIAYRFAIASLVTAGIVKLRGKALFKDFKAGLVLGVLLWLIFLTQTSGLVIITASNSGFITGLYVPLVPVFGLLWFRRGPRVEETLAVTLAVAGLWVLTGGIQSANRGDLLTLGTAMVVALHILFSEKYVRGDRDPFVLSFQQFFVVFVLSAAQVILFGLPLEASGPTTGWTIVYLALFATISTFAAQTIAQKHVDAVPVALIFTLEPVFAALFAWTLGGELFRTHGAVGGSMILVAMLVPQWRRLLGWVRRYPAEPAAPRTFT